MFRKKTILFLSVMIFLFAGGYLAEGFAGEHRAHMMGGMMGGGMSSEESCMKGPEVKGHEMMRHKMGGHMMMKGMGMPQMYSWEYLKQKLGLTDEQAEKLGRVYFNYRKEVLRKKADIEIGEMELRQLLRMSGSDKKAIEKAVRSLEASRSDLNMARINSLLDTKEFLNDEQYENFSNYILGWMRPGRMEDSCCQGMGDMMGCGH